METESGTQLLSRTGSLSQLHYLVVKVGSFVNLCNDRKASPIQLITNGIQKEWIHSLHLLSDLLKDRCVTALWVARTLRYCRGRIREPGFIFFFHSVYGSGEPTMWTGQVLKHSELITYDLINTKVWEPESKSGASSQSERFCWGMDQIKASSYQTKIMQAGNHTIIEF